jgi:hypothetical protein
VNILLRPVSISSRLLLLRLAIEVPPSGQVSNECAQGFPTDVAGQSMASTAVLRFHLMPLPSNRAIGVTAAIFGLTAAGSSVRISPPWDIVLVLTSMVCGAVALASFLASRTT